MRKSNAPSFKSKFTTPWVAKSHKENKNVSITTPTPQTMDTPTHGGDDQSIQATSRSSLSIAINSIRSSSGQPSHTVNSRQFTHHTNHEQALASQENIIDHSTLSSTDYGNSTGNTDPVNCSYYKVMWCKMSKKKHKTWEGDAVLIAKGRNAILKDMEGKEIGRSTGYKSNELHSLIEGNTLYIGSKEIEVMSHVSEEEWSSGRCFTEGATPVISTTGIQCNSSRAVKRGFVDPMKERERNSGSNKKAKSSDSINPLHNPNLPNALVLPKPSSEHQLIHNHHGLPCVDVVVDPRLSNHLRPHQRQGVLFLYECVMSMRDYTGQGAILGDEMGLGKSLQCITLIWTLVKQGPYGGKPVLRRVVIVTPGSLVKNWLKEFQKWLGTERLNVFAASTDKRPEDFVRSPVYPVLIISYELFMRHFNELSKVKFDMIICDEGHRLKNSNIKTSSALSSLPILKRIVLSGTPIQNDLIEFYSLVEFCNPGVLGSLSSFKKIYEEPIVRSNQTGATHDELSLGQSRADELNRITSLFYLRRTQEINNQYLPPKIENIVFCRPSSLQLAVYRVLLSSRLLRSCFNYASTANNHSSHLVCIGALKKLCNCPSLVYHDATSDKQDHSLYDGVLECYPHDYCPSACMMQDSGKLWVLAAMLEYLSRTTNKIVVISNYTKTLDILQRLCETFSYRFLRLDGQTPSSRRIELVERFNRKTSNDFVFLLSSKAGGVGLNLIGANHLILYDIDWNPANDLQAMARVWRDGQTKPVHVYRLLTTGTIEEKIFQRQISKQGLSGVMDDTTSTGGSTHGHAQFTIEELKDLFSLNDVSCCLTHDQLECNCFNEGEDTHQEDVVDDDVVVDLDQSRACGLGRGSASTGPDKTVKNLSIDKLKKWKHFCPPFNNEQSAMIKDDLLIHAADNVTFIMQNETIGNKQ